MRRKIWSAHEITETMQVQNFREMGPNMLAGGEGLAPPPGPGTQRITTEFLSLAREAGGEGTGGAG